MPVIKRSYYLNKIKSLLKQFPIVAILGPRQCGKTTLAKQFQFEAFFDLENPRHARLLEEAQLNLENLSGLIGIDEIQRRAELFPLLRYLVDHNKTQKFLILGSASQELIKQSSESLAGRIAYLYLNPFSFLDLETSHWKTLWLRGGYPNSYLAKNQNQSNLWLDNYILTFLERDLPQLGINIPSQTMHRFWIMLSHYHGQILNYSELSRSFGISDKEIKKYLDILSGTFMIKLLQPWFNNAKKRLVKSPKLYIRDSGIFHRLQSIKNTQDLITHPKVGASWEAFVIENISNYLELTVGQQFFWATHNGAELDFFWQKASKNFGIEIKYAGAPKMNASIRSALQNLDLEHLWVIYPGDEIYKIDFKVTVLPITKIKTIVNFPTL